MAEPTLKPFTGNLDAPSTGGLQPFTGSLDGESSGGTGSDLVKSLKVGAQRLPGMVTGLADLPFALANGSRPVTKAADALGDLTGFQPGKWADETKFSAGYDESKKAIDDAWKDGSAADIAKAYVTNPAYTGNQVVESLPGMVAGGLAGRALMGAGRVAGIAADAAAGTAARAAAPGALARTVGEKWAAPVAAGVGEGAVTAGQQMAQYQGDDQQKNAVAALGAGALTGAIGVGAGRVANRLGLETAETAIVKAGTGATADVPLSAKRRILGGMVSEAVLQEMPQSAQEQMWQNWSEGKPLMEGVGRAATEGGLAGVVMGAGANVSDGGAGKRERQARELDARARQAAESAAADAQAKGDELVPSWGTELGASGISAESATGVASPANAPGVDVDFTTSLGAASPRTDGLEFTSTTDTSGLSLDDGPAWDQYNERQGPQQRDYLSEVQDAVRSGTPFTSQETVDTVRSAMEDAWLAQNVTADAGSTPTPEAVGAQLQDQFSQAGQDAALASNDTRVRTGRILNGLQNILDTGADNTVQVLNRLNEGLVRINEAPLAADELGRVRRITDAYMGFKGVGEVAPLPNARTRPTDPFADNAAMEALIPERPSQRMGIDPNAGPLSKVAATAVDTGISQEIANAQAAQGPLAGAAAAVPATRAAAVEAAGSAPLSQPAGVTSESQADQAQQAETQPSRARAAPAQSSTAGPLSNAAPSGNNGAQAAPQGAPQGQTQGAASPVAARPEQWRKNMLRAAPVAKSLGIDHKGKRLAQVVAEIDAADAKAEGRPENGADLSAGQINQEWSAFAPETGTLGIPRAEMPQIKAEHRGALVNFLKARGIDSRAAEMPANDLKPTQAEFSPKKVQQAREFTGGDRSILVSSDGFVVDGHHQWLAKRANGEPVKVIQLKAPIQEVLAQVREFPSLGNSAGATQGNGNASTTSDLRVGNGYPTGNANAAPAGAAQPAGRPADTKPAGRQRSGDPAEPVAGVQPAVPDGSGTSESTASVDPDQQRKDFKASEAKRRAPGDRARARAWEENPLRAFLAKHGIARSLASEWAPGPQELRAAMVQGYGPIFRKSGLQLDRLAQAAREEGFLREADDAAMHALIDRAMRKERVTPQFAQGVAETEMEARIARQREMEEDNALAALDQTEDAIAFDLTDPDADIPWDAQASSTTTEDAMRALGFSEQEIQDAIAQESRGSQEGRQGRSSSDETAARESQVGYAPTHGESRPGSAQASEGGQSGRVEEVKRDGYTRDLFGGAVDWSSRAEPAQQVVPGNVRPAAGVQGDTDAPAGDYRARTIVGTQGERQLGTTRIQSVADLAAATQYLYRSAVERFDAVVTDADGKPLAVVGGFKGAVTQTSVYPATVMGEAIRVPGAARIWFSHNHPSGSSDLSSADRNLDKLLGDVFRGTGIEPMGLIAVGDGQFAATNGESGQIAASTEQVRVPVIERELGSTSRDDAPQINSPADARALADAFYKQAKAPGLMLLDAKLRVAAWVPLPSQMMGNLRDTGQLRALYRAVSESNANAVILAHGGELDANHPSSLRVTIGQNIGAALEKVDVRVVDIINTKTKESAAESGSKMSAGPVYSRQAGGMSKELAAELSKIQMPATVDSVRAAVRQVVNGLGILPNSLGRIVVATSADIKKSWEPLIGDIGMEASDEVGKAQGFYDPNTKTVFLIADNIKAGEEPGVIVHELMHKHGQAVLGQEAWDKLHGMISAWATAPVDSMERIVYDDAIERVRATRPPGTDAKAYSSQELFPYAVQIALDKQVKPNLMGKPGTVARWLGEVKRALRQVWEKITRKPDAFNTQDLVNLAFGIAQRENPEHGGVLDGAIAPLRKAANFLQARQAVREFQGKELTNAATGMTAVVSRNSLDKMLSGKAVEKSETPATHVMAVANADSLFERAVLGWSKPDRSDDPSIGAIHRFFAPMDVAGRTKLVKLTVKETRQASDANPLYTVEAVELNENLPGDEWIAAAAREDGVSLDEKNPLQRGVGGRKDQQTDPRPTLAQPRGLTPGRSTEDVRSLAQDVERRNSAGSAAKESPQNRRVSGTDTASGVERSGSSNPGDGPIVPDSGKGGIQFSRTAATVADGYTTAQQRAAEHAFGSVTKQTLAERARGMKANLGTKIRQGLVDQFAPIKEISDKAYIMARLSKGSDGAVEAALLYGKPFLRDGVADVDIKDGGFAKVLASLNGEHDRFFQWVAAQRAERLKAEGKENLLTDQDITALKSLNSGAFADGKPRMPAYATALRELNAFNEASLKVAMESGLIDQAAYDLMKDQPYVPFYRLMEEGDMKGPRFSSGLVNQQAWKKLKGGTQQLNADLLQNTLMNWSHLYSAAARNRASLETMNAASSMGIAYQVAADTKGSIKVMRDGVTEHWAVEDPYLLDAITAMSYTPGGLTKAMGSFKRLLTFGVTVNPTFKIRNLIRDTLSAMAQSELSYNPLENLSKGWKATATDSQTYASMLAGGGVMKFGTQEDSNRVRAQIEKLGGEMMDKTGFEKLKGQMKSLWGVYEEFGDRTENVNRAALYERLIAKGHSHAEANFMARDLMDFSMSGKWEVVRFLTQTVPFLNARLQGLYKLGRAAKEDPKRFAAMTAAVSIASLGLMAAYGDDEDWKKREDWDRDAYWWFKIGGTAFRVPKPFELGSLGTLAERTAELMFSKEMTGKRFGARISDMVFNTFAMDPTPQFIKPFLDVYSNKDSFSGRAIEGFADERLRPQDRFNERTSEVARLLGSWGLPDPVRLAKGEYSALSPKQVDFLMRGYFGWLATVSTTATDTAIRPFLDRGERPAMRTRDIFVAGNFVEQLPTGSSRYVSAMYEQSREIEQAWASYQAAIKSGDTEKAQEIQKQDGSKLQNRMAVANAKRQIAEMGQQAKRIESSKLLSADEKRERLAEIENRKHEAAKRVAVTS